jgi:hypothetical protein
MSINLLRKHKFYQKTASSSSFVHPQGLPPTAAATEQHSLISLHQVQECLGRHTEPLDWGWTITDGMTNSMPAPSELMTMVKCKCRTDCPSAKCSCRKSGLKCTLVGSECKGIDCQNCGDIDISDDHRPSARDPSPRLLDWGTPP